MTLKKLLVACVCVASFLVVSAQRAQAHPLDLIYTERLEGRMETEDFWRNLILALYDPQKLPAELRDARPTRAVTLAKMDLLKSYNNLSQANRDLLKLYGVGGRRALATADFTGVADLTETTDVSAGGVTYRIHYTTNTNNQDAATTAFVTNVGTAITTAVDIQKNTLGYAMPYRDAKDGVFDVYLSDRECGSSGTYGYVSGAGTLGDNPNSTFTEQDSIPSYMVLDNDFSSSQFNGDPTQNLNITFAHEHFHAIQFGTSAFNTASDTSGVESSWLAESTATWMESQVYDVSGTYTEYQSSILTEGGLGVFNYNGTNLRQYGHFMLHKYMEENGTSGQSQAQARSAIQNTYFTARTSANQTGKSILQIYREQVQAATRFTTWLDLVKEFSIANLLRSADVVGPDYLQYSKAASYMQTDNGGNAISPTFENTTSQRTFTGTTLTFNGTNLKPLGYHHYCVDIQTPATISLTNNGSVDMSATALVLGQGLTCNSLSSASSRSSLALFTHFGEMDMPAGQTVGGNDAELMEGVYLFRVLNTSINPGNTTGASYTVTLAPKSNRTLGSITVSAAATTVAPNGTTTLTFSCKDQSNADRNCPPLTVACAQGSAGAATFTSVYRNESTSNTTSTFTGTSAGACNVVATSTTPSMTSSPLAVTVGSPTVTINCSLSGDSVATHPHIGDAAVLLPIVVAGSATGTACAGGACDFDKSGVATPDTADMLALTQMITGEITTNACGSVFGQ